MGKEIEPQGEWQANLERAREILSEIRETLILSWLKIHLTDDKKERIMWGERWGEAVKEEVALTGDVIAPAKIELGLPIANRNQERRIKRRAGKISKMCGKTPEEGIEIARRQIRVTKKIQHRLGVDGS